MTTKVRMSLEGKVALVTGGSRGIGAATVELFVAAGAQVGFSYRNERERAERLVACLGAEHCAAFQAELTGTQSARELVNSVVNRFGRLDVLVANHGIWPPEPIPVEQMPDEHWQRTIAIDLDSVFALVKHSVAQMKRQAAERSRAADEPVDPSGHIVLVSSTAGQRGEAFHTDYAAAKGALISMVKGLSTELAPHGIRVNCVAPGWVETDMSAPALADPRRRQSILEKIPLGRVATPQEIAAPILFLCTAYAGFITGEIFNVNGGAVLVG